MIRRDNITIPQGTDCSIKWDLRDPDDKPFDTTGWSARSQARRRHTSTTILHEWTSGDGSIEFKDGALFLHVPNQVSADWEWKSAVYDIEIVSPGGTVIRVTEGTMAVSPEVTR